MEKKLVVHWHILRLTHFVVYMWQFWHNGGSVLTPTMCVRSNWYWIPLSNRRCHVCYFCIQDRFPHLALDRFGFSLSDLILSYRANLAREHYNEEEPENMFQ